MRRTLSATSFLLIATLGLPGVVAAEGQSDPASEVLAVFTAKCAGCHGPDLPKPRGRFGYVLDLNRVAANREMVIPGSPEESELWGLVSADEMPPPDSPTGQMSAAQKETIRSWIAAGAPQAGRSQPGSALPSANSNQEVSAVSPPWRNLRRLGALHVAFVHFPIALLIAATFGEAYAGWRGLRTPTPQVRFCVALGSMGALAAMGLGWLQARNGYGLGRPQILFMHRWIGTATAVWTVGAALLCEWDERRGTRSLWFRAWLFITSLLVALSGHLGGVLVHGNDYFTGG